MCRPKPFEPSTIPHISTSPKQSVLTITEDDPPHADTSSVGVLQLSWRRMKRNIELENVFILTRRNYKVYADIGVTSRNLQSYVTILDTGAG